MSGETGGVVFIALAYGALALLLVSLNLLSLWRPWVKAGAVVVTAGLVVVTYDAVNALTGWPAGEPPGGRFKVLWTAIEEPDKATGSGGAIYLWVQALDDDNAARGKPRAHEIAWDDRLARAVAEVQDKLDEGAEIMGTVDEAAKVEPQGDIKIGKLSETAREVGGADTVPFAHDSLGLTFEDLPPVELPDKGPI